MKSKAQLKRNKLYELVVPFFNTLAHEKGFHPTIEYRRWYEIKYADIHVIKVCDACVCEMRAVCVCVCVMRACVMRV